MTNLVELRPDEKRFDEACEWIAKLDRGLSGTEKKCLQTWLSSLENRQELETLAEMWDRMDSLSRLAAMFPKNATPPREYPKFSRLAVAASLVIAVFFGSWAAWFTVEGTENRTNIYQTSIGEFAVVTLADGSELKLNTDSRVEVDFSRHYRLLKLIQGEVNVKVAKDPDRPLGVLANGKLVQAIGTEFNVEIKSADQLELVVTEGKVKIAVVPKEKTAKADVTSLGQLTLHSPEVEAGEQAILKSNKDKVEHNITKIDSHEIKVKLSWQKGDLVFRGEPLEEAIREVGRYTSIEFVILDDSLRHLRIVGLFRAGDVDSLLNALRENFKIDARYTSEEKILLSEM